jgi:hypothetical protein
VVPVECVARPVSFRPSGHTHESVDREDDTHKVACLDFAFVCACVCVYPGPINDLFLLLKEMMTNAVVIHHCVLLATIAASWGVYTIDGIGRSIIREYLRAGLRG